MSNWMSVSASDIKIGVGLQQQEILSELSRNLCRSERRMKQKPCIVYLLPFVCHQLLMDWEDRQRIIGFYIVLLKGSKSRKMSDCSMV